MCLHFTLRFRQAVADGLSPWCSKHPAHLCIFTLTAFIPAHRVRFLLDQERYVWVFFEAVADAIEI
jgi:hypothetical protein